MLFTFWSTCPPPCYCDALLFTLTLSLFGIFFPKQLMCEFLSILAIFFMCQKYCSGGKSAIGTISWKGTSFRPSWFGPKVEWTYNNLHCCSWIHTDTVLWYQSVPCGNMIWKVWEGTFNSKITYVCRVCGSKILWEVNWKLKIFQVGEGRKGAGSC